MELELLLIEWTWSIFKFGKLSIRCSSMAVEKMVINQFVLLLN